MGLVVLFKISIASIRATESRHYAFVYSKFRNAPGAQGQRPGSKFTTTSLAFFSPIPPDLLCPVRPSSRPASHPSRSHKQAASIRVSKPLASSFLFLLPIPNVDRVLGRRKGKRGRGGEEGRGKCQQREEERGRERK
eukprot:3216000-Rhodomonas_salina.2